MVVAPAVINAEFVLILLSLIRILNTATFMKNLSISQLSKSINSSKVSPLNKENIQDLKKRTQHKNEERFINLIMKKTGLKVTPEFRFHSYRKWRIDYAIVDLKIAIEVEGGVFISSSYVDDSGRKIIRTGGRHNTGKGFLKDIEKYNTMASLNWLLIRTTPDNLLSEKTLLFITDAISSRS